MLKTYYVETIKPFSPERIDSGWAQKYYGIGGDSMMGFMGYKKLHGRVISHNIPQASLLPGFIQVLNFIIEHHHLSKTEGIAYQRLLASLLSETLGENFHRKLGALFFGDLQISQSKLIATWKSCVIYYGILIEPRGKNQKIRTESGEIPVKDYTISLMQAYQEEVESLTYLAKQELR